MVKDLWALRLHLLKSKIGATSNDDDDNDDDTLYSSQPQDGKEIEDENEDAGRTWKVRGEGDMPLLIETLGLCYLGTILLRLPVSIGEIHRYVDCCPSFQVNCS